jgi:putative restriction endonuclease
MPRKILFGEIYGIEEGHWFKDRKEMMPTSFHRRWGSGIDGNGKEGASAIVLSGGYEDDLDLGDEIIYTVAGGNDVNSKRQTSDQNWQKPANAALLKSFNEGLPVRVIRGYKHKSKWSPSSGYNYAGLYSIVDAWIEQGKSGYKICRIKLVYSGDNHSRRSPEQIIVELDHEPRTKQRQSGTILRIVRDSKLATTIKELYEHKCQICNEAIPIKDGFYAEGAHIRPLGRPHDGDDSLANLLCLCPNHHVMLDKGSIIINEDFSITGAYVGKLNINKMHKIDNENIVYHRGLHS